MYSVLVIQYNVEDSNKHIIEEIVRQVGHLPELYEDARSEKYKISCTLFLLENSVCHIRLREAGLSRCMIFKWIADN
jgi:hypothetical protein